MAFSQVRYRRVRIVVVVAFIALSLVLVAAAVAVPEIRSFPAYIDREPIEIHGDSELNAGNGVTGGSGNESDPYIIEGWGIEYPYIKGIEISDVSAYVIIRNIAIHGSFHPLYSQNTTNGIVLENSNNIVVERAYIAHTFNGVLVKNAKSVGLNSVQIRESTIVGCFNNVYLFNSSNCTVDHNVLRDASSSNVMVDGCSSIAITNNEISRAPGQYLSADILAADSADVAVRGNLLEGRSYYRAYEYVEISRCKDVEITRNEIGTSMANKVEISDSSRVHFDNNTCYGDGNLYLTNSDSCDFANNELSGGTYGSIRTDSSSHVRILRNNINGSWGIHTQLTTDSIIDDNIIINSRSLGMTIDGSNVTVARNLITHCQEGIMVGGSNITVKGNLILHNGLFGLHSTGSVTNLNVTNNSILVDPGALGIYLSHCSNVLISGCNVSGDIQFIEFDNLSISGNRINGSYIMFDTSSTGNVEIVHNSMYNVSVYGFTETATIIWDNGYPDGGNYWSQYVGVDEKSGASQNQPGADGIGDTPYVITPKSSDQYPFMEPVSQEDALSPITMLEIDGRGGGGGWFLSDVNCTFSAQDNLAGVKETHFRLDSGPWSIASAQLSVSGNGEHLVEYYSEDWAGNAETTRSRIIRIDTEPPQLAQGQQLMLRFKNTKTATIHYEFEDSLSGMLDGYFNPYYANPWEDFTTIPFAEIRLGPGTTNLHLAMHDVAGNVNKTAEISLVVSLNENRDPTSFSGPYGPWYNVGLVADLILLLSIPSLSMTIRYGPIPPRPESGEIDKDEVIDGYPKYLKKF